MSDQRMTKSERSELGALIRKREKVFEDAEKTVEARCRELGIPEEFAPSMSLSWYGRGENAVAMRRAELRRAARSKIDALEKEARVKIERMSLEAQTQIIATGLETDTAKTFLENLSMVDEAMPSIDAEQIHALVDARHKDR